MKIRIVPYEDRAAFKIWIYRDEPYSQIKFMRNDLKWENDYRDNCVSFMLPEPTMIVSWSELTSLADHFKNSSNYDIPASVREMFTIESPPEPKADKSAIKAAITDLLSHL